MINGRIHEIAEQILEENPDPAIQVRLLRDVLGRNKNNSELNEARSKLDENKWVQILRNEQWEDGSWGRIHTQDTSLKQQIPTTELGVSRAINLGLDKSHPVIHKVANYILGVLNNTINPRDSIPREISIKNWYKHINKIVAASLAEIDPNHFLLKDYFDVWSEIIQVSFPNNEHNEQNQLSALLDLFCMDYDKLSTRFKQRIKERKELTINDMYTVRIISTQVQQLLPELEKAYFQMIWSLGIGYLEVELGTDPRNLVGKNSFPRWLRSLELIKPYPSWKLKITEILEWLWNNQTVNELWDFGNVPSTDRFIRISSNWRKPNARIHDWTTRILLLLTPLQ